VRSPIARLLESANGGTLLLDEIEDLAPAPQVSSCACCRPASSAGRQQRYARSMPGDRRSESGDARLVQQKIFARTCFSSRRAAHSRAPRASGARRSQLIDYAIESFNRRTGTRFGNLSEATRRHSSALMAEHPGARKPRRAHARNSTDPVVDESLMTSGVAEQTPERRAQRIVALWSGTAGRAKSRARARTLARDALAAHDALQAVALSSETFQRA